MAGNRRSGRPRTPVENLKLHGTFREDRHAERAQKVKAGGQPEKPKGLDDDATWLWDLVMSEYAGKGILARLDTAHIWAMCESWSLYRKAVKDAMKDPLDKPTRAAVTAYKSAFDASACRVGLNPCDRERIAGKDDGQKKSAVMSRKRA